MMNRYREPNMQIYKAIFIPDFDDDGSAFHILLVNVVHRSTENQTFNFCIHIPLLFFLTASMRRLCLEGYGGSLP
jgi:hypothetical protein